MSDVIFVEDDAPLRAATAQALMLAGHDVRAFADARAALAAIPADFAGAIVSDIRMPGMDGLAFLAAVLERDPDLSVILVTGHGDVAMAVSALHRGAFDFLTKPFATEHLTASVARAVERRSLVIENRRLRAAAAAVAADDDPLIGDSPAMTRLRASIHQLAQIDVDVLVEGETGTGKELVATLLHRLGPRRARPFVAVNCGALPEGLAEIELFGHASDSVAHTRLSRDGQIAASSGGTLLLDEIDSMPLAMQARLLRVLEEREVQPIGETRPRSVDLRVVATTKTSLSDAVAAGRFRADLFYRLDTVRLRVPPLREREGDAFLLFAAFLDEARGANGPRRPYARRARDAAAEGSSLAGQRPRTAQLCVRSGAGGRGGPRTRLPARPGRTGRRVRGRGDPRRAGTRIGPRTRRHRRPGAAAKDLLRQGRPPRHRSGELSPVRGEPVLSIRRLFFDWVFNRLTDGSVDQG